MLDNPIVEKIGKVKNFEDLTPETLLNFSNAIVAVNEFQNNISKYATNIFKTKFIGTPEQWEDRLTTKDYSRLSKKDIASYSNFLFCYKKKKFFKHGFGNVGWIMGSYTGITDKCTIDENNILIVKSTWETKESRFDFIPWISHSRTIKINYLTGEILSLIGDDPILTIN